MHAHLQGIRAFAVLSLCLLTSATTAAGPAALDVVLPVNRCAELTKFHLADIGGAGSAVLSAQETTRDGVAVCTVDGRLAPSIGFRVHLPTTSWTQRYLQVGCGGLCGNIPDRVGAAEGCAPLAAGGFVIASTDMGHQGMGGEFGRDAAKRNDFAHRAVHLTAVAAKGLIQHFYGRREAYAYFTGCSDGGREALIEAQRYPGDFNGIIAGAAALNFQVQNGLYHAWQALANTGADGKPILLAAQLPILHKAVLAQCDALDGHADGLIADPRACHFDPLSVQCADGAQAGTDCLSPAAVAAARKLYAGPRDPASGARLTIGGPQPGSELAWAGVFVPSTAEQPIFSEKIALDALRNLIFETNPPDGFKLSDLKFDLASFARLRARHPLFDATNPDLSAFAAAGGKLIIWHGWSDPHISPLNSIAYHEAVHRKMGAERAGQFERLYLLPGVYHCAGGEGPSLVDFLTPMMAWVENAEAPDRVIASQASPQQAPDGFGQPGGMRPAGPRVSEASVQAPAAASVARSRPLFPYPGIATYSGSGDSNRAEHYRRAAPLSTAETPDWAGADFFSAEPVVPR